MAVDDHRDSPVTPNEAAGDPGDWVDAPDALRLVARTLTESAAMQALMARAFSGMLRTKAKLYRSEPDAEEDFPVPRKFWLEGRLGWNWDMGDFTSNQGGSRIYAYGVQFSRSDLEKNFSLLFSKSDQPAASTLPKTGLGRPMSEHWPEWVAEIVLHIHENGYPAGIDTQGQNQLIDAVAGSLAERALEAPARSTVLDAVKAILRRGREAGN